MYNSRDSGGSVGNMSMDNITSQNRVLNLMNHSETEQEAVAAAAAAGESEAERDRDMLLRRGERARKPTPISRKELVI